jgi:hypothetical protein
MAYTKKSSAAFKKALTFRVESDLVDLRDTLIQLGLSVENIGRFISGQARLGSKRLILSLIPRLSNEAGNFPLAYSLHLIEFMNTNMDIKVEVIGARASIIVDLTRLGDKYDLTYGYHHQALLGEAYGGEEGEWEDIHPAQVDLPWEYGFNTSELMSSKSRRREFWEQVVIGRDIVGFANTLGNPGIQAAVASILSRRGVPTYEQVAAARVAAWREKNVAPEWLLLEYGAKGTPLIKPVNFLEVIENALYCYLGRVADQAEQTLLQVFDRARNVTRVSVVGRPYEVIPGRGASFVRYADIRDLNPVDITPCLNII